MPSSICLDKRIVRILSAQASIGGTNIKPHPPTSALPVSARPPHYQQQREHFSQPRLRTLHESQSRPSQQSQHVQQANSSTSNLEDASALSVRAPPAPASSTILSHQSQNARQWQPSTSSTHAHETQQAPRAHDAPIAQLKQQQYQNLQQQPQQQPHLETHLELVSSCGSYRAQLPLAAACRSPTVRRTLLAGPFRERLEARIQFANIGAAPLRVVIAYLGASADSMASSSSASAASTSGRVLNRDMNANPSAIVNAISSIVRDISTGMTNAMHPHSATNGINSNNIGNGDHFSAASSPSASSLARVVLPSPSYSSMAAHLRTVLLVDVLSAAHYLELPTLMRHVAALIAPHVSGAEVGS